MSAGCATYQQQSAVHLNAFRQGNSAPAIAYYERNQQGRNKQLHMVEAGRLKMLEGDFWGSHYEFLKAIEEIFDLQEGAVIRLRDVGGTVLSSTFLDDRNAPYNLPSFEAVMAFQYQALNSIFLGDIDAAAVELRRAVAAQDLIADKYEQQVEQAKRQAEDERAKAGIQAVNDYYAQMGPVLGRAKSGFQNAFVWYFAGLIYELQQDPGNAYIAYKKAWELAPDNRSLQRDLLRLARQQNPEEWATFRDRFQLSDPAPPEGPVGELIVVYEEGLISQRYSVGIPIFVIHGYQKVTFPVYRDGPYQPGYVRVAWDGQDAGELMPLAYVQSLAYHDLNERISGIAARNVSRAITREVAKAVGRQSDNSTVQLITFIGAGVASLADEADTRGWYSLPMGVQLLRTQVPPGEHTLRVTRAHAGRPLDIPVSLAAGEKKLIWVADKGARVSYGVASLTHADVYAAQFSKIIGGTEFTAPVPPQTPNAGPPPLPPSQNHALNPGDARPDEARLPAGASSPARNASVARPAAGQEAPVPYRRAAEPDPDRKSAPMTIF